MSGSEIGSATFGLVVGMGRFKKGLSEAEQEAGRSGRKIGDEIVDGTSRSIEGGSGKLKAAAAGVAAVVGGAIALGIADGMEQEALNDRLGAQLGLSGEQAEAAGRAAGNLYANAYGESLGQVNDAVGAVWSTLGDSLGPAEDALESATAKALDLASAFGIDVQRAVSSAGILISSGLAKDVDHAFDLMTVGMQKMPAHLREELLEATDEYSQFFGQLGFSAEQTFGLLVNASKDGMYGIDKTGDAIKEFTIRATDMSTTSTDAFKAMGEDAQAMATSVAAGGESAQLALGYTVESLLAMEDPVERANAAIALFGAPLEDLGTNDIPKFLSSLTDMNVGLGDVGGAAEAMGDQLADNAKTKFEAFHRSMRQNVTDFVNNDVLPVITGLPGPLDAMAMGFIGVGGAAGSMLADIGPALSGLKDVGPSLAKGGKALLGWGGSALKAAGNVATWATTTSVSAIKAAGSMAMTVASTIAGWTLMGLRALASAAQMAAAWLIAMGPVILVGAAIAGLVALVIVHWDTIKAATGAAWDWVYDKLLTVRDFVVGLFMNFTLPGLIIKHWDTIKSATGAAWQWIRDRVGGVVDWFKGIPSALATAGSGMWDFLKSGLQGIINKIVRGLEWMANRVVDAINKAVDAADVIAGPWINFGKVGYVTLPRVTLHSGGIVPGNRGDEVPTLLKAREGVFTETQMEHLAPVHELRNLVPAGGYVDNRPIIVNVDGKKLFEIVRDRETDLDRNKHGGGRTRRVA